MLEHEFHTPNPVRLEIKMGSPEIRIESVDGDQSSVIVDGPEKLLETVRVELIGDRLVVEHRRRSSIGWFGRGDEALHVRARVPNGSKVTTTTASGNTTLDGSFAELDAKSASGDVALDGELSGPALVRTVNGGVRLDRIAGGLMVQTVSGDVKASFAEGSVVVKSVSGDVRVESLSDGEVKVQSVSGDVELGIAPGTSIDVDAGSASGNLSSEVPLAGSPDAAGGRTVVIRGNTVSGDFRVFRAARDTLTQAAGAPGEG